MRKRIYTKEEFIEMLVAYIDKNNKGNREEFARSLGYSTGTYVRDVINGDKTPSTKMVEAIGLKKSGGYIKA